MVLNIYIGVLTIQVVGVEFHLFSSDQAIVANPLWAYKFFLSSIRRPATASS